MNPVATRKTVAIVGDLLAGFPHGLANTRYIRLLAQGLAGAGRRVRLPIPGWTDRRFARSADVRGAVNGVEFEHLSGHVHGPFPFWRRQWLKLRSRRRLEQRLEEWHADGSLEAVVYDPWTFQYTPLLARFCRRRRVPLIVLLLEWPMAWDELTPARRAWFQQRHDEAMSAADGFWVVSGFLADRCAELAARPRPPRPVLQVPILLDRGAWNGVEASSDPAGFVYCASLDGYRRDALFVLEAFARSGIDGHRLTLIGPAGESTRGVLSEHMRRLGLKDRVDVCHEFVPERDLLGRYAGAAALLAPLWDDDRSRARFPSKLADCLYSGRPVVSNPVGEAGRYLADGESAFLARPGDVDDFGQRMRAAVSDPDREAIGRAGRRIAVTEFALEAQGRRAAAYLDGMVGLGGERTRYANRTDQQLVSATGGRR